MNILSCNDDILLHAEIKFINLVRENVGEPLIEKYIVNLTIIRLGTVCWIFNEFLLLILMGNDLIDM